MTATVRGFVHAWGVLAPRRLAAASLAAGLLTPFLGVAELPAAAASANEATKRPAASGAAQLPTGDAVLDRYVEVTGGKDAYLKVKNRVTRGTLEVPAQGLRATMTIYAARPRSVYLLTEIEGIGRIESGVTDSVAWEVSSMTGPRVREGQERISALRDGTFDRFVVWRDLYRRAECLGVDSIAGKACYRVVLTPDEGKPQTFYYDCGSGLLVKVETSAETPGGTIPIQVFTDDYRAVDGILIPHRLRTVVLSQERIMTVERVEHDVELPADRFALPPAVKALLDRNQGGGPPDSVRGPR
jgi:hypothetical protein